MKKNKPIIFAFYTLLLTLAMFQTVNAQSHWSLIGDWVSKGNAYPGSLHIDKYGSPYTAIIETETWTGDVKKFDGTEWITVGNFPLDSLEEICMVLDNDGAPVVSYIDISGRNTIKVLKYNGKEWMQIGAQIVSNDIFRTQTLSAAKDGTLYLCYTDAASKDKITVMKFNDTNWTVVGTPAFTDGFSKITAMAIDGNGTPYIAFSDGDGVNNIHSKISVFKFDGTNWVAVGARRFSANPVEHLSLSISHDGTPYVAYDDSYNRITVAKYDGTDWIFIRDPGILKNTWSSLSIMIDCDGIPFLTFSAYGSLPCVLKFEGGDWVQMYNSSYRVAMSWMSIATDCNGKYYLSYMDHLRSGGKVAVAQYGKSGWTQVGKKINSDSHLDDVALFLDTNNVPYVIYQRFGSIDIKKYDGSDWVSVSNSHSSIPGYEVYFSSIAMNKKNKIYWAYRSGNSIVVQFFDGVNWQFSGKLTDVFGANNFYMAVLIAFDQNDIPYILLVKDNKDVAEVYKYNGLQWKLVGEPFSVNYKRFTDVHSKNIAFNINKYNTPYIAYTDRDSSDKVTVIKYDGNDWLSVGKPGFSKTGVSFISLAFDTTGVPLVAYVNSSIYSGPGVGVVMKYDGVNWITVGDTSFAGTDNEVCRISMIIDRNNTPFLSYSSERNKSHASVVKYNGTKWIGVGANGFIPDETLSLVALQSVFVAKYDLALSFDGTPYVACANNFFSTGSGVSIVKYNCPAIIDNPGICAVYTDSVSGNNVIEWNSCQFNDVDSYKIYRTSNSTYVHIATVSGNAHSYIDLTANPSQQSYAYKLTVLDNCGQEMDINTIEGANTIKLTFVGLNGIPVINWNSYNGISNPVYNVLRKNTNEGYYKAIASFNIYGKDTTYVDTNPPVGANTYRIDIGNPSCKGGVITSNTVSSYFASVSDIDRKHNISVLPNPASSQIKVVSSEYMSKFEVFNMMGQKMITRSSTREKEIFLDVSMLPTAMYFIRIDGVYNVAFVKK